MRISDWSSDVCSSDRNDDFRMSIAGAQEKTALLYFNGRWCRPRGATPTSHILKLPMGLVGNMRRDLGESDENEWLCAQILTAYGLSVELERASWRESVCQYV